MVLIPHQLGGPNRKTPFDKLIGALSIIFILSAWFVGPLSIIIVLLLLINGWYTTAAILVVILGYPFLFPFKGSDSFCKFFLLGANWFDKGVTLWLEDKFISTLKDNKPLIVCMHPHGIFCFGFTMNGAIRFKANKPESYLHKELHPYFTADRVHRMSGIQAPILFKTPLVRPVLNLAGCCTPAAKGPMLELFAQGCDFGILPGGIEELLLHEYKKERVYIVNRAGFIKYALCHGYRVVIGYSFGESDLYHSVTTGSSIRLWLSRYGITLPIFYGKWWFPLLPEDNIPVNTVFGAQFDLPKIPNPTNEEVEHYHKIYMKQLKGLFEEHKSRFGYGKRQLEFL